MSMSPKKVFFNGKYNTMNSDIPTVEAICVSNGLIECMGTYEEMEVYLGNTSFESVDLQGKYVYPGFIDTHSHLSTYSKMIDWAFCGSPAKKIDDVLAKIKEKAMSTPKGQWVFGYSYDDSALIENRHLNKVDLDSVSQDHPIVIFHISSHMGYVNSLAIQELGITKDYQVEGGEYVKDEKGELTGFLIEFAFFECIKSLPQLDKAQLVTNMKRAIAEYNSKGITTFFDGGVGFGGAFRESLSPLLELSRENALNARAYLQFFPDQMQEFAEYGLFDFGNDFVKFGGLKYFTDGSIQCFTACLLEPYHTKPDFKGTLLFDQEAIDSMIEKFHAKNIQIAVHTNGDGATEVTLQAFEKAFIKNPRADLSHMIIHAQMVSDNHLERMKKMGIIPSFFSRHVEVWGDRHAKVFIGEKRMNRLNPAGSAVRLDMPFTLHVDTPVLPVTVLGSMHAAVNRVSSAGFLYGEDQRISPKKALEAYTTYAALCCNDACKRGSLAVGKYADFVVLEDDLLSVEPTKIKDIKVLKTICGGNIVFEAK